MATEPKHRLFEYFAKVARAIGNAKRLELLEALAQGERPVDALARATGMPVANTSHHLQKLREAGLAEARKAGLQVFYRLSDPAIPRLIGELRGIAERRVAEVERIVRESFETRDPLEAVDHQELLARMQTGDVVVIDVRPEHEYRSGHIPGALHIPLETLSDRLRELPTGVEIVAYCRGPYCMLAFDAVERLRSAGISARRLQDGFPEWKAGNLPVTGD